MRVIVAPTDIAPVSIAHPVLLQPKPDAREAAAARVAVAEEAAKKADQARLAAVMASREVAQATMPLRRMRNLKLREEERLAEAEQVITSTNSIEARELAEAAKATSAVKMAELEAQLASALAELQPQVNALVAARKAAVAAERTRAEAAEAARAVTPMEPVSVFISRKTQRLYIRQAFQPVLDIPVTIRDPNLPIGTHIFTAVEQAEESGMLQWSVVSLVGGHSNVGTAETQGSTPKALDVSSDKIDLPSAKVALDRIVIPDDTIDRIAQMLSPRSSVIISDEGPSSETGRGTDFVIVMSDEPHGGLAHRQRGLDISVRYEPRHDPYYRRSPFGNSYSTW
jgi:hypothetical protein